MRFTPILAAAEKSSTSVMDALPHLAGMAMVMLTLVILWGVCVLTAKLVSVFVPEPKPVAAPVAKTPSVATLPAVAPDQISPETVAVIAASVATVVGKSCRIISIKPMSTSWERAGRQSVLTSHRIR